MVRIMSEVSKENTFAPWINNPDDYVSPQEASDRLYKNALEIE